MNQQTLVGSVSHAFLGPLNSILNVADMLMAGADKPDNPHLKRDAEEIIRDAERLAALWARLRGLLELDVSSLDLSDVDLPAIIRVVAEHRGEAAQQAGIALSQVIAGPPRNVRTNSEALVALVGKLLDHCLAVRASSAISVVVAVKEGECVVSVLEDEPQNAERYTQPAPLPSRRIRDEQGIDLLICHWLARLNGASLWTSRRADTDQYAFHIALEFDECE